MAEENRQTTVCTLFEKDFHYGLGALVNSLYVHGYRGIVWAGYRGFLPPWVSESRKDNGYLILPVAEALEIRFVEIKTTSHFTNYKPTWMMEVLDRLDTGCQSLCYFDPDITVNVAWDFFEKWLANGIALCQDVNYVMPSNHPIRKRWECFLNKNGFIVRNEVNFFFNCGFIGIKRDQAPFLKLWESLMRLIKEDGMDPASWHSLSRTNMFMNIDQDALNIAAMVTDCHLSTVGPEGMGFMPGALIMAHALGSPKPWNKNMTYNVLWGEPLRRADKEFFKYTRHPIALYSSLELFLKMADLKIASAVNRVAGRR